MTSLLVKLFVKDYENINSSKVRTSYGLMASIIGILCNLILFGIKITIGLIINSISVMADAFNNLSDAGSSLIGFAGVKLAGKPADKEHPYGHGRFEYIAALIVAFLILQVGFSLLKNSFAKVLYPETIKFDWIMILILSLSVLMKVWLAVFNRKLGNRINSSIMKATSADSFSDVAITSTMIISLILGNFIDYNLDGWMGLIVSGFIIFTGFMIAKDTIMLLLGEPSNKETLNYITNKVESYYGIIGCHDLMVHNYGPSNTIATIHAEVSCNSDLEEIHSIIDKIEKDIFDETGILLVIHIDPV